MRRMTVPSLSTSAGGPVMPMTPTVCPSRQMGRLIPPPGAVGPRLVLLDHQTGEPLFQHLTGAGVALAHPLGIGAGDDHPILVHDVDVPAGDLPDLPDDGAGRRL